MNIHILTFGPVSDHVPGGPMEIPESLTVGQLKERLHLEYHGLQPITYSVAVNRVMATDEQELKENAEIALLPPFSGG